MILYLDTSALVKAYVSEANSDAVLDGMAQAQAVASHSVAYVEAHAAFARLLREGALSESAHGEVRQEFRQDWPQYLRLDLTEALAERAVDLAEAFALRAYDSLHLAAADYLQRHTDTGVTFACFDRRLNQAARVLGLELMGVE